jgi:hypothetical protein
MPSPIGGQFDSRFAARPSLNVTVFLTSGDSAAPLPVLVPRPALRSGSACRRMTMDSAVDG